MTQIISIVLQVGIWMTPIMWQITVIPAGLRWIFKLNPVYYVVSGYRESLLSKVWFWQNWQTTLYFWIVVALLFVLGNSVFKKLKVHFADVL